MNPEQQVLDQIYSVLNRAVEQNSTAVVRYVTIEGDEHGSEMVVTMADGSSWMIRSKHVTPCE
jgi:hypothetical protein